MTRARTRSCVLHAKRGDKPWHVCPGWRCSQLSPFTRSVAAVAKEQSLTLEEMFKRIGDQVYDATEKKRVVPQRPYVQGFPLEERTTSTPASDDRICL